MKRNCVRLFAGIMTVIMAVSTLLALSACDRREWEEKYDTSLPSLLEKDGWRITLSDEFNKFSSIEDVYEKTCWRPSPHGKRKEEYWCDQMIDFDKEIGAVVIRTERKNNHVCDVCDVNEGIFTGGIETASKEGHSNRRIFEQAYGYFEAEVKVPTAPGMWSAFWLQSYSVGKIGNKGRDGTEIDIYESSYSRRNKTKTGNALHWDAYDSVYYKYVDHVTDVGINLYDGLLHTYSLLWTPNYYVFYVDRKPVWATDAGGVSTVKEYLRLTVEVRDGKIGPYGQSLGKYENASDGSTDFYISRVSVWQNAEYEDSICSNESYVDMKSTYDKAVAASVATGVFIALAIILLFVLIIKRCYAVNKFNKNN